MKVRTIQSLLRSSTGLYAFVVLFAVLGLPGCDRQGPAEEAGEKIDQTAEDASAKMDDAKQSLTD